jgi:hypothetical protein
MKKQTLIVASLLVLTSVASASFMWITSRYIQRGPLTDAQIEETMSRLNSDAIRAPGCDYDQTVLSVSVRPNDQVVYHVNCKKEN